ncbi:hypothetical protein Hanom_Chr01g00068671 [Helianthus anomalus]
MPKTKKAKKSSSLSSGNVITELNKHLSSGKSYREEATLARSAPTPAFSRRCLPVNETDNMEVEDPGVTSKGDRKTQGEAKVVTFSGTILDSSLGLDCFIDDEEDQVSSLPPSWFGPDLMPFFRYADVFADDMEIDSATADENFVPKWEIRNKDSVIDDLTARMFLFNVSTRSCLEQEDEKSALGSGDVVESGSIKCLCDRAISPVEAESVKEDSEKETIALKRNIHRTPDTEKKLAQLSQDLQA